MKTQISNSRESKNKLMPNLLKLNGIENLPKTSSNEDQKLIFHQILSFNILII